MFDEQVAHGRRILVVEDEMAIVVVIEAGLAELGAQIVGPVARLDAALRLAREEPIDAAVLDVNIRGGDSYPVADVLVERQIPFIFCRGYAHWAVGERHRDRPTLTKPYNAKDLASAVRQLFVHARDRQP